MKIQKLILSNNSKDFKSEVNGYLNKGAVVVPQTLNVESGSNANGLAYYFFVILEGEEEIFK